jgi:hypothetical protein
MDGGNEEKMDKVAKPEIIGAIYPIQWRAERPQGPRKTIHPQNRLEPDNAWKLLGAKPEGEAAIQRVDSTSRRTGLLN